MLREIAKLQQRHTGGTWESGTWESGAGRIGRIIGINGNGTYTVDVDGVQFTNVVSGGTWEGDYIVGQTVRVEMLGGQTVITSQP